jgi:hypothetical protein
VIPIPTSDHKVSLQAQAIWPTSSSGRTFLQVAALSSGARSLTFGIGTRTWQTYVVHDPSELAAAARQPVIYLQTVARFWPTGAGLPAPGKYFLDSPLYMVWNAEQTGGILIPLVRFLLLAERHHHIADQGLVERWRNTVIEIARSYGDEFSHDGDGGLVLTNAFWMPSPYAGQPAETDYINAEISMRLLLYELTHDERNLWIARGLFRHESKNLQISAAGWLQLKYWPDARSWTSQSSAVFGSIWDEFHYNPASPEIAGEGGFFVEMLQIAAEHNLAHRIGLTPEIYEAQRRTLEEYQRLPPSGARPLLRYYYPLATSKATDRPFPTDDPVAAAGYLQPIMRNESFICDNWRWMLANGMTRTGGVGHVLRAWARSEAAWRALPAGTCPLQ